MDEEPFRMFPNGLIEIRRTVDVTVEGTTVSVMRHYVLSPDDDISEQSDEIKQACQDWWTPDRIAAYQQSKEDQE